MLGGSLKGSLWGGLCLGRGLHLGFESFAQEGSLSCDTTSCTSKLLKLETKMRSQIVSKLWVDVGVE